MNIKRILRPIYIPIVAKAKFLRLRLIQPLRIMSAEATIDYIIKHHCSIARYGDGELNSALHDYGVVCQKYSESLSLRLREVMTKPTDGLLVCLPRAIRNQTGLNAHAKEFWLWWSLDNYDELADCLYSCRGKAAVYGDASITRPYKDWVSIQHAERVFAKLKMLWDQRDLLIIEGEKTKLGVGNDLLQNAASVKRILCSPQNAFDSYDEILRTALDAYKGELVLIALGPAATVLAYDLSRNGIQALDVGHMDIEYEWMLQRATEKVQIAGKYTNEANSGVEIGECTDPQYLSQIILRVNC